MKRSDFLNAIDQLEGNANIESAIEDMKCLAVDLCNHYECDFNSIRDALDDLAPHIDAVKDAHDIAERCSSDLY
jgi:hypothetical protein